MQFDIDSDKILTDVKSDLENSIKKRVENVINNRLYDLFYDSRPHGGRKLGRPDEGLFLNLIEDALVEVMMDPKWTVYAKELIEKKMPEEIAKAVAVRCEHAARKIAHSE